MTLKQTWNRTMTGFWHILYRMKGIKCDYPMLCPYCERAFDKWKKTKK